MFHNTLYYWQFLINKYSLKNNRASCSSDWPQTQCVTEDNPELLILYASKCSVIGVGYRAVCLLVHCMYLCVHAHIHLFTVCIYVCMHTFTYYHSSCWIAQTDLTHSPPTSFSQVLGFWPSATTLVIHLVRWQITNRSFLGSCNCHWKESAFTAVEIKTQFFLNY